MPMAPTVDAYVICNFNEHQLKYSEKKITNSFFKADTTCVMTYQYLISFAFVKTRSMKIRVVVAANHF